LALKENVDVGVELAVVEELEDLFVGLVLLGVCRVVAPGFPHEQRPLVLYLVVHDLRLVD